MEVTGFCEVGTPTFLGRATRPATVTAARPSAARFRTGC